jgi:hypothetical protein
MSNQTTEMELDSLAENFYKLQLLRKMFKHWLAETEKRNNTSYQIKTDQIESQNGI